MMAFFIVSHHREVDTDGKQDREHQQIDRAEHHAQHRIDCEYEAPEPSYIPQHPF